jgi:hypothetical protein
MVVAPSPRSQAESSMVSQGRWMEAFCLCVTCLPLGLGVQLTGDEAALSVFPFSLSLLKTQTSTWDWKAGDGIQSSLNTLAVLLAQFTVLCSISVLIEPSWKEALLEGSLRPWIYASLQSPH